MNDRSKDRSLHALVDRVYPELRMISFKIRGIAYLLQTHREEAGAPLDSEEIWEGVGEILAELGLKISSVSREIDESLAKKGKAG